MTIAERYKNWRRARIIKTLLGKGQQVPGETRIRTLPWRWPRTDWTLYNSELLFAAVSRLANAFASMPVQLYRRSVPVYNALNDLVSRAPNPNMTAFNWRRALEVCRCAGGNAYAMKVLDAQGKVHFLHHEILGAYLFDGIAARLQSGCRGSYIPPRTSSIG